MNDPRLRLSTVLGLVAIASAGAFAAGRSMTPPASATTTASSATAPAMTEDTEDPLPVGHPAVDMASGGGGALPPGHPALGSAEPGVAEPAAAMADPQAERQGSLVWKAPARWESAPNASTMRLATFRVPRAPGDAADAELSITQAGGTVEANAARWVGQFDEAAQKTAKRSTRKVAGLDVTLVEVQGNYSPGMGAEPKSGSGWALLGAIVATPGMPYFLKLTGPAKTVAAARTEFIALLDGLTQR